VTIGRQSARSAPLTAKSAEAKSRGLTGPPRGAHAHEVHAISSGRNASACAYSPERALAAEMASAKQTLHRSIQVAAMFTAIGLSGRGKLEAVPVDNRYWFAKLYENITYNEILACRKFTLPAFVLHFIPVFYDMYYQALMADLKGQSNKVSPHWRAYFKVASSQDGGITDSIIAGVSAHINGDMEEALVQAYLSYISKYSRPKQFDLHYPDFFLYNRPVFEKVTADFFTDLSRTTFPGPVEQGQFAMGVGSQPHTVGPFKFSLAGIVLGKSLDVDEVYEWRQHAWERARRRIGK